MELMNLLTELTDSVASYVSGNEMTISIAVIVLAVLTCFFGVKIFPHLDGIDWIFDGLCNWFLHPGKCAAA